MVIIKPEIIISEYNGLNIMRNIERACRVCYKSQDKITDNSYKQLLKNCINRGHESILEHEKITVDMIVDIGVYKDLTRHRHASFSIESSRYCNYSKDKFDKQLRFIEPVFYKSTWMDKNYSGESLSQDEEKSYMWYNCMEEIEDTYMNMAKLEASSDELRMILPHSIAAEVTMTANIREWRHILSLRCSKMAHPSVQQVMIPILLNFKSNMQELFDDITYNEDFDINKFASLTIIK